MPRTLQFLVSRPSNLQTAPVPETKELTTKEVSSTTVIGVYRLSTTCFSRIDEERSGKYFVIRVGILIGTTELVQDF